MTPYRKEEKSLTLLLAKKVLPVLLLFVLCIGLAGCDGGDYKKAVALFNEGNYLEAGTIFENLDDYENSAEMAKASKYCYAVDLFKAEDYDGALEIFKVLGNYEQSAHLAAECNFRKAEKLFAEKDYSGAIAIYESIPEHTDAASRCRIAKVEQSAIEYADTISAIGNGTWLFNGGDVSVVNIIKFSGTKAVIKQLATGKNGTVDNGTVELDYIIDDSNIYLLLPVGGELKIAYEHKDGVFNLTEEGFLTFAEVEADLQGYWVHSDTLKFGRSYGSEEIFYFENGKVKHESASEAMLGGYGQYYYYGPYSGTYTLDENGMEVISDGGSQVINGVKYVIGSAFGIVDGKAVYMELDDVFERTNGFKGENGFVFNYFD